MDDDEGPSGWTIAVVISAAALTGILFYAGVVAPDVLGTPRRATAKPAVCSCPCHTPEKSHDGKRPQR